MISPSSAMNKMVKNPFRSPKRKKGAEAYLAIMVAKRDGRQGTFRVFPWYCTRDSSSTEESKDIGLLRN